MSFKGSVDSMVLEQDPESMGAVVSSARAGLSKEDVAYLARSLAESGHMLPKIDGRTSDVASTGGPSSLSTLLCPLFLVASERVVPKLGVPGRPAGGVDVLGSLTGYSTELKRNDLLRILDTCGYAHFRADESWAPADARLFEFRKHVNAQKLPDLVVASLLSKKLAVGLDEASLDVRVARHGNFGINVSEATANARRLCEVADIVGLKVTCYITDATRPYQPYIGRGEALIALHKLFTKSASSWLNDHFALCARIACGAQGESLTTRDSTISRVSTIFFENLEAQGASKEAFLKRVAELGKHPTWELRASHAGELMIDLGLVRTGIVSVQKVLAGDQDPYPDPCGVTLLADHGEYVEKEQPLVRVRDVTADEYLTQTLRSAIKVSRDKSEAKGGGRLLDVVGN